MSANTKSSPIATNAFQFYQKLNTSIVIEHLAWTTLVTSIEHRGIRVEPELLGHREIFKASFMNNHKPE